MADEKKSFWSTLPGILTGIAAVIGAIVSLIAILHSSNIIPDGGPEEEIAPLEIHAFTALPQSIEAGDHATLNWSIAGANDVSIYPGIGDVELVSGTRIVAPERNTDFILTARNDTHGQVAVTNVSVTENERERLEIASFAVNPDKIRPGDYATLIWSVSGADHVEISNIGDVEIRKGCREVNPKESATYILTAGNMEESATARAELAVLSEEESAASIDRFVANPESIIRGGSAILSWGVSGADEVILDGKVVGAKGEMEVTPVETTSYPLLARSGDQVVKYSIQVHVEDLEFAFSPRSAAPGEEVEIGLGFSPPGGVAVFYDGKALTTRPSSDGKVLAVTLPMDATSGYFEIEWQGRRYRAGEMMEIEGDQSVIYAEPTQFSRDAIFAPSKLADMERVPVSPV